MNNIEYKKNQLYIENKSIDELISKFGSPLYIYSQKSIVDSFNEIKNAVAELDALICYSVKTCSNINIIKLLKTQGAGCDIVSGGELYRTLKAGVASEKIVYAGVGKTSAEIEYALKSGILMFNCESEAEIELINQVAMRLKKNARIAARVNPDVDAHTHAKITTGKKENKFGIPIDYIPALYKKIKKQYKNIELYGVHCHIGSQITEIAPYISALDKMLKLIDALKKNGISITTLNLGGGFGINYQPSAKKFDLQLFKKNIVSKIKNTGLKLLLEPGRFIAGNSGVLATKIIYIKTTTVKNFAITDAAMNDLIRPTLYEAYHHILPTIKKTGAKLKYDIVGPVCESGDFFAKDRELPKLKNNDNLAILSAGAYGFSMASNYNSRPRCAEVLVNGNTAKLIRRRETYEDLINGE